MSRRGTGVGLCFIASLLMISRYITAAIFGSGKTGANEFIYNMLFDAIGPGLTKLSVMFFVLGFIYLALGEITEIPKISDKVMKLMARLLHKNDFL